MFDGFSQFAGLLKNLPKMREEMDKLQRQLAQVTAEGDAGAGMVKVKVNGHFEVLQVTLAEDALKDRELLEDLVAGAVNQALKKVKQSMGEQTAKVTAGLGLPPGFQLPG